jgi:phospholipid N-methyltransferase
LAIHASQLALHTSSQKNSQSIGFSDLSKHFHTHLNHIKPDQSAIHASQLALHTSSQKNSQSIGFSDLSK